jgi:hypothetical protein
MRNGLTAGDAMSTLEEQVYDRLRAEDLAVALAAERRRRGCTCADPAYHPDPHCREHGLNSPERKRRDDMVGYGQ